jgi:hypothetical protein
VYGHFIFLSANMALGAETVAMAAAVTSIMFNCVYGAYAKALPQGQGQDPFPSMLVARRFIRFPGGSWPSRQRSSRRGDV